VENLLVVLRGSLAAWQEGAAEPLFHLKEGTACPHRLGAGKFHSSKLLHQYLTAKLLHHLSPSERVAGCLDIRTSDFNFHWRTCGT
jgi:hypothetical protein